MDKKYNQIALNKKDYKTEEDFWNTVKDLMKILLEAHYEVESYWECLDAYIFNFNLDHREYDFGIPHITWIDPDIEDIVPIKEE